MDAIAGSEVAAGLGDANDRAAGLEFAARNAVIGVALDVDGGFTGFRHVVEPDLAAERLAGSVAHDDLGSTSVAFRTGFDKCVEPRRAGRDAGTCPFLVNPTGPTWNRAPRARWR